MADSNLKSSELKAFCENIATMLSVGIQMDEAVHMLAENSESKRLAEVCLAIYPNLIHGNKLSQAMIEAGCFPEYAVNMVAAGENTGHVENTLASLAIYYDEEDRLMTKIRTSVAYPAILLCVMSVILAFTVAAILPVFLDVYDSMAGGLAVSSYNVVNIGIVIGWIALILTLLLTLVALYALIRSRSVNGRNALIARLEKFPGAKRAFYDLALSRFASTLSVYIASGSNTDIAMGSALETIEHSKLRAKMTEAYKSMLEPIRPKSLLQALADHDIFDPLHMRMLTFGTRTGRIDDVLEDLSEDLFDESVTAFDSLIDKIEPILAAFVTVAVGLTLIAVMLPLIGMMGSIG